MATLYLTSDMSDLRLKNGHVEIYNGESEERASIRLSNLDRVVVVGQPRITFPALLSLADDGIPTFFMTTRGRWRASLLPDNNRNAARRILQYERANDAAFNLCATKGVVMAKIRNARRTLQRLVSNHQDRDTPLYRAVKTVLTTSIDAISDEMDVDSIRGYEGVAAARYFEALGTFFPENMPFGVRSRRPPHNPANALLSFSYAILLGEVECRIRCHGLDSSIGNLHRTRTGSPSLALDLMEPFRPAFCDRFVLDLVGHGVVRPSDHFIEKDDGVSLCADGRKTFFRAWDAAISRRFENRAGLQTNIREEIDRSVMAYIRMLEHDEEPHYFQLP